MLLLFPLLQMTPVTAREDKHNAWPCLSCGADLCMPAAGDKALLTEELREALFCCPQQQAAARAPLSFLGCLKNTLGIHLHGAAPLSQAGTDTNVGAGGRFYCRG